MKLTGGIGSEGDGARYGASHPAPRSRGCWGGGGRGRRHAGLDQAAEAEKVRRSLGGLWGGGGVLGGLGAEAHPPAVVWAALVMRWWGGGGQKEAKERGTMILFV